jgi:hypothetical protein
VGGVLVGQSLITASQRQQILSQKEQYDTAVQTFRLKYNCLPGDCRNASAFFSGSYNGDGNRFIWGPDNGFSVYPAYGASGRERCNFFAHLSAAHLIELQVTPCTNHLSHPIYGNTPPISFNPLASFALSADCAADDCNQTGGPRGPHFWFANGSPGVGLTSYSLMASGHVSAAKPFTVEDVRWFDRKIDDGLARAGKVRLIKWWSGVRVWNVAPDNDPCINNGVGDEYKTSETNRLCYVRMEMSF